MERSLATCLNKQFLAQPLGKDFAYILYARLTNQNINSYLALWNELLYLSALFFPHKLLYRMIQYVFRFFLTEYRKIYNMISRLQKNKNYMIHTVVTIYLNEINRLHLDWIHFLLLTLSWFFCNTSKNRSINYSQRYRYSFLDLFA